MASNQDNKNNDKNGLVIPLTSLILEEPDFDEKKRNGITQDALKNILVERTKLMNDVSGIYELNPDIRLAREISVAQTLSPKDLSSVEFKLHVDRSVYAEKIDPELLNDIEGHFKSVFDLEAKLPEICGEALFDYGAFIYLFIPPNYVDDMIADGQKITLESFDSLVTKPDRVQNFSMINTMRRNNLDALGVSDVTLDVNLLKRGRARHAARGRKIDDIAMEAYFGDAQFRTKSWERQETVSFKKRKADTELTKNPMVLNVAVDSTFIIHNPTDSSDHLAYIFPIDEDGRIISYAKNTDYAGDLERKLKKAMEDLNSQRSTSGAGNGAFQIIKGNFGNEIQKVETREIVNFYSHKVMEPIIDALVEKDLVDKGIDLQEDHLIYQIMLERALKNKKTKLLFIPADYVSYIAFDFNASGQGVGLIEKNRFFASLRAILQIADMMSAVTNSIPRTELSVTLDDTDNDPMGTIESLMHELGRLTVMNFPIGSQNPSEIISAIQKSAYALKIDGGDKFPKTAIERTDVQRNRTRVDSDLNDDIKRKLFAGLGVPVEAIDRTLEGETATALILNDLMAAKRAMERQLIFRRCIEDVVRTYIYLSPSLMSKIKEKIKDDTKREDFIWGLRLLLPTADTSQLEQQAAAFQVMEDLYDKGVNAYMTDDMLRGMVGNNMLTREILGDMREMFKAEFMRQYMRRENILPELDQIVNQNKDENIMQALKDHYSAVFKNMGPVIKEILGQAAKIDKIGADAQNPSEDPDNPGMGDGFNNRGGVATPFGADGQTAFDDGFDFKQGFSSFEEPPEPNAPVVDTDTEAEPTTDADAERPTPEDEEADTERPTPKKDAEE